MTERFTNTLRQVRELSIAEKIRLMEYILPELETAFTDQKPVVRRQWKGIFGNSGPVPTEADIEEIRREAWPRQ